MTSPTASYVVGDAVLAMPSSAYVTDVDTLGVVRPAPVPKAVLVTTPDSTSPAVIVYVAVQVTVAPTASVVAAAPQLNAVPPFTLLSATWNWVGPSGALPVLVSV